MKIHKASKRLPKLLPINPKKRRYQLQSKRCVVWWKWVNEINNQKGFTSPEPKFARMYKNNHWQIEGVQGETQILYWMYIHSNPSIL